MVIDALVAHTSPRASSATIATAAIARSGKVHERLLEAMLSDPYFASQAAEDHRPRTVRAAIRERPDRDRDSAARPDRHCHRVHGAIDRSCDSTARSRKKSLSRGGRRAQPADHAAARANCCRDRRQSPAPISASIPTRRKRSRSRCWRTNSCAAVPATCRRRPVRAGACHAREKLARPSSSFRVLRFSAPADRAGARARRDLSERIWLSRSVGNGRLRFLQVVQDLTNVCLHASMLRAGNMTCGARGSKHVSC